MRLLRGKDKTRLSGMGIFFNLFFHLKECVVSIFSSFILATLFFASCLTRLRLLFTTCKKKKMENNTMRPCLSMLNGSGPEGMDSVLHQIQLDVLHTRGLVNNLSPSLLETTLEDLPEMDNPFLVTRALETFLWADHPDLAILVALRYGKEHALRRIYTSHQEFTTPGLWRLVLLHLAAKNSWVWVQDLLAAGVMGSEDLFSWMSSHSLTGQPRAVSVFQALLTRPRTPWSLRRVQEVVSNVTRLGLVEQYEALVHSPSPLVRGLVLDTVSELVNQTCLYRLYPRDFPHMGANYTGCLAVACTAGLLTATTEQQGQESNSQGSSSQDSRPQESTSQEPTSQDSQGSSSQDSQESSSQESSAQNPQESSSQDSQPLRNSVLEHAVGKNQPDLVRFLYYTGAASTEDLHRVSRLPSLQAKTQGALNLSSQAHSPPRKGFPSAFDTKAAQDILQFATSEASSPRPLTWTCVLQVSRGLGWGHGREERIEGLPVQRLFKNALKFDEQKQVLLS